MSNVALVRACVKAPQRISGARGARRAVQIARLDRRRIDVEAARSALRARPASAAMTPAAPATLWVVVVLLEALKAAGPLDVGAGQSGERSAPSTIVTTTPGQALARRRWG